MTPQLEIQIIACVVSAACALPGVFLVLRKMAMMSDVITHAILPGIVVAFFITHDLSSPLLIVAAAATGVLTVVLVEVLTRTRLVKEDAAMGLVFPALFSIGVILISRYAGQVHLDTDAVLLGELAFAPFDRLEIAGWDVGPKSLWVMGSILLVNAGFILLLYKELKLVTFDEGLAAALGISPLLIHYSLMSLVSVTAVGAFDAVGSILVVALMIAPPATAYLLTDRLSRMILLSAAFGVLGALSGYFMAARLDASIAGSMATMSGVIFTVVFVAAPERGLVAVSRRRRRQRWEFAEKMLAIHLLHHENEPDAEQESHIDHLQEHLRWPAEFAARVVRTASRKRLIDRTNGHLALTERGRVLARQSLM